MPFFVDRNEIVDAINYLNDVSNYPGLGLCWAFNRYNGDVVDFLRAFGGTEVNAWFWPLTDEGRQQRLMFLAFMLTWYDDMEAEHAA